jgi:outer membrane biosynthesis protein TonB
MRQALPELQHLNPLASIINQQATQQQEQKKHQQKKKKSQGEAGFAPARATAAPTRAKAVATPADKVLAPWLAAMRSEKPELRRQAAMIALVGGVVMGPPKCRHRR